MAVRRLFRRSSASFLLQYFNSASTWRFLATRRCHAASLTGLYGFRPLKNARGFKLFVDEAIERSNELIAYIESGPSPTKIIDAMDEISNTVCCVVDSAELCRHTHPDREFVHEANKASVRMNEYLHFLNTNNSLYNAVKKAEMNGHLMTKEARRAAANLRMDFEKGGIHLSNEKLERVNKLNVEISSLCREFGENIIMDPGHVDVFPATLIPKHLHHQCKPIHKLRTETTTGFSISRNTAKERGLQIPTDATTLSSILQWTADEEVRKMAYIKGNSTPFANIDVLGKLITARHELAQIIGYRSYSDFMVNQNMASSSGVVMSFLLEMRDMIRDKANQEFNAIKMFKRERSDLRSADLEPWDEAYYTAMMKSSMLKLDSSVVAAYFPLPGCINGLKLLVESLFGASFQIIPSSPGESWHPDVIKMSLHHPHEGDLGYLYLDLYAREGKYPGCAHFAVKGGRRISNNKYQLPVVQLLLEYCLQDEHTEAPGTVLLGHMCKDKLHSFKYLILRDFLSCVFLYCLPRPKTISIQVVALVCNFSGSPDSSSARLNQWEVETLFHEFGHALHSLLSRTDYQHFSGTRVVLDLAETPSNLFEYYANDYRVLRMFAKHYSTGESIPEKLVEAMQSARKMFAATELQRQIFYAMVDQTLFGDEAPLQRDTSSTVADIKRKFTCWKHVDGTHWQARFSHLLNYGAGYYSYLYAKCLSSTIWKKVCQDDPLSSATGDALRTKFLQHGGAKESSETLNDLVGGGILRDCGEGIVPDITCLAEEMDLAMDSKEMEGLSTLVKKQRV